VVSTFGENTCLVKIRGRFTRTNERFCLNDNATDLNWDLGRATAFSD